MTHAVIEDVANGEEDADDLVVDRTSRAGGGDRPLIRSRC